MTRDDPDRAMIQIQLWWLREIQIEWWYRSSSDDLDWEMIHIQIQIEWWSRSNLVMLIQIERWSKSSDDVPWWSGSRDDLDLVMMIQIEWWSRFSNDDPDRVWSSDDVLDRVWSSDDVPDRVWSSDDVPDRVWSSDNDLDRVMIQIQMKDDLKNERWIEDEDDEDLTMTQMIQRRRLVLINCVERIPS